MDILNLEEVFTLSGIPKYTYVIPEEYTQLKVAIRTPGRGVVIEGPSGIGKTTAVLKIIDELKLETNCLVLTPRRPNDIDIIKEIPYEDNFGTIIIDDFHRLEDSIKSEISNKMKLLADEESKHDKLIIIGINKAGDSLVRFSPDLNNRIDTIHFEKNSNEKIEELITKGEAALNIILEDKQQIITNSYGSFHIAQMLCQKTCIKANITETCVEQVSIGQLYAVVLDDIFNELSRVFFPIVKTFATGPRLRKEGRAPYLHILNWLAISNDWSLELEIAIAHHPRQKGGVGQVVDKKYLDDFIDDHPEFNDYIHYDKVTKTLSVDDPKFVFYLRNILWTKFAKQIGYVKYDIESAYDIALSFAGSDRIIARKLFDKLAENEIAVFYDENEQARILASNVEDYLFPIYKSEATFIVPILGKEYPNRLWTKFESDAFKSRFGENGVIPIWISNVPLGLFDESKKYGGITFDIDKNIDDEIDRIVRLISGKVLDCRMEA